MVLDLDVFHKVGGFPTHFSHRFRHQVAAAVWKSFKGNDLMHLVNTR